MNLNTQFRCLVKWHIHLLPTLRVHWILKLCLDEKVTCSAQWFPTSESGCLQRLIWMGVNISPKMVCFAFTYHPFAHSFIHVLTHSTSFHCFKDLSLQQQWSLIIMLKYLCYSLSKIKIILSCYLEIIYFDILFSLLIYVHIYVLVRSLINSLSIFIKLGSDFSFFFFSLHILFWAFIHILKYSSKT